MGKLKSVLNFILLWIKKINWKSKKTYIVVGILAFLVISTIYDSMQPAEVLGDSFEIQEDKFIKSFKTNGKILPHLYSDISAMSDGVATSIYHNVGDYVNQNTSIIKLSNPDMERAFTDTELSYDQAKLDYERDTSLYNSGAIARYEYQVSELKYKQAKNNYIRTKEKVFAISPISGTVYAVNVAQGQSYRVGTILASVGKLDRLEVKIFVDQPDISKLYVGEQCEITSDAIPNQTLSGQVINIPANIVTQGSRTGVEVTVNLDKDTKAKLLPNTKVNAKLIVKMIDKAITVPIEAVLEEGKEKKYLYKINLDNQLTKTIVTLGEYNDTQYQVLSGLRVGDKIFVNGTIPKTIADKKMIFKAKPKVD